MKITLHTLRYQHTDGTIIKRPWVWADGHGWNHFYPELIDSPIKITSLDHFYHVMKEHDPDIEINATWKTVLYEYQLPPNADRIAYLKVNKALLTSIHPNITYTFPQRTLLLVGDFNDQCEPLAQQFEAMGWDVKRCATDLYDAPQVDYNVLDYQMSTYVKDQYRFSMELYEMGKVLNYAQADHILVVQNELALDFKYYKDQRVHYYAYRGYSPRMPHNTDITCFFHSYLGAPNQYKNAHRYRMSRVQHKQLIPYAWDAHQYPTGTSPRDIFFGFMGSYGSNPDPHDVETMDYVSVKLRYLRNLIVPHAVQRCELDVRKKGTEMEYLTYMQRVLLALNVSSEFGWTTQRQYHAMGMGCVLVQNYYKGLAPLGFQDCVNCLLYHNKYELEEVIDWARRNPVRLEDIRCEGMKLATKNQIKDRVQTMMEAMIRYE